MEQVSYKQRILSLIKLNKTDVEIKEIIREEYKKVFKLSDIEYLRSTDFVDSDIQKQDIEDKISFVLDLLRGNPNKSYTKKQIVDLVKIKHEIKLSKIEIKEILWSKLRSKIIYDSDNWTYKFKDENNILMEFSKLKSDIKVIDLDLVFNIIKQEKFRIGKSDANLLAENIIFRLKNNLWD